MKISILVVALLVSGMVSIQAQHQMVEHGANYRVWQKTTYEGGTNRVHRYTELATGLYFTNSSGQLVESKEVIETFPRGAIARQGPYQVIFANNLNSAGAIDVQTLDGKRLRSSILGLLYYDTSTGSNVLFAQIQSSQGGLISSNQVLYPDAFDGLVKADVRYTYRKGSFEQDVILRTQPPAPELFGLNPQTTEIEVLTEFIDPPQAKVAEHKLKNNPLPDDDVDWGVMQIGHGRAFDLGEPRNSRSRVTVRRQYVTAQGRNILVEGVPIERIKAYLANLPLQASSGNRLPVVASKTLALPQTPLAQAEQEPMKLASASTSNKGFVLDYVELNTDTSDFTFQAGTTYFMTGNVSISGTTTFEGGTVIKYPEDGSIYGSWSGLGCRTVVCDTTPYSPAVFTSQNDNSVGDTVDGSSGSPAVGDVDYIGTSSDLDHCRFYYAGTAVTTYSSVVFSDVQLFYCNYGIVQGPGSLTVNNALASCCLWVFDGGPTCDNCTFDSCNGICDGTCYFANCIFSSMGGSFSGVGSIGYSTSYPPPDPPNYFVDGSNNGFNYNLDPTILFGANQFTDSSAFQSGPLGNFYLSGGNQFIAHGNTTADQVGLYWWTTQTGVQTFEGISTVDLGYHYPAVDANYQPISTEVAGVPDYISDPGGNGLPDAWEMQYFGNLNHYASDHDSMNRTLLYDYQHEINPLVSFQIITQPVSQTVYVGATVTFSVQTAGDTDLNYQWTLNGVAISGATSSSYTINNAQAGDAGDYRVTVSKGGTSITSDPAHLTVKTISDPFYRELTGPQTDYTFKSGVTYNIGSSVSFSGNTTIEGGAILKFNYDNYASLQIKGTLACTGGPYNPAILTSIDDDSVGEFVPHGSQYNMGLQPVSTGVPYLEMADAQSDSINNLRICYADGGVSTPTASRRLDVWDCQFVWCNYGVVNQVEGAGAIDSLHNVLFDLCYAGVYAVNAIDIEAEQVTADVYKFCDSSTMPGQTSLVNSLIGGTPVTATALTTVDTVFNPAVANFQTAAAGGYYLTANSTFHHAGTADISPRLQTEFKTKTTYAPVSIAPFTVISGQMTLAPQAQRYTGGAPDLGYYYDALDYTVADMILNNGALTILPGTAIGWRFDYGYDPVTENSDYTYIGMDVYNNSSINSQGTPLKPNTFVDVQCVQEGFEWPVWAAFVPDFFPYTESDQPPSLNFRFSNFYLNYFDYDGTPAYHFWTGYPWWSYSGWALSYDSAMFLTLSDCQFHGGQIVLGPPLYGFYIGDTYYDDAFFWGPGAVSWNNNLFENVGIALGPTWYYANRVINCDMQIKAENNLFKNSPWLVLAPNPTMGGNHWVLTDNLFDKVEFYQDTSSPLDYDYNGYWPRQPSELLWIGDASQLQPSIGGAQSGTHEVVLATAPPYASGPYGNYYLPDSARLSTPPYPLYQAGSRTAGEAGLGQYTMFVDQTKDTANQPVNIGLHYVATSSSTSTAPKDTDADGIPDYVENWHGDGSTTHADETSWQNAQTISGTPDSLNSIYDDVDLSGNGLVGRIKKALGKNPLDASNPLSLTQITTGEEPDIATFKVPVDYDTLANIGQLELLIDGSSVQFQECVRSEDGKCLLKWNTTFDPPGQHYLAAQLTLFGNLSIGDSTGPDPTVLDAMGAATPFYSDNGCQFDPFYSEYDDNSAILHAQTYPYAEYSIELRDGSDNHLTTFTGYADENGEINETWYLVDDSEQTYNGNSFSAAFTVTPPSGSPKTHTAHFVLLSSSVIDGLFTVAYASDNTVLAQTAIHDCIEWSVVDPLIQLPESGGPGGFDNHYDSLFNAYTWSGDLIGNPGYLSGSSDAATLVNNLGNLMTRNFHFDGHGSKTSIGNNLDGSAWVDIPTAEIKDATGNHLGSGLMNGIQIRGQPYRFVFLNGCETADNDDWHIAFGVYRKITSIELQSKPQEAQAFVGWVNSPRIPVSSDQWYDFASTYAVFYDAWMSQAPLDDCLDMASMPLPFEIGGIYIQLNFPFGKPFLPLSYNPETHRLEINHNNFHLRIYGYAGLQRIGYDPDPRHDNSIYYK